ncbi:MAG: DNA translocase FtsK 4TM domain-containing protein [Thermoanaerobaculia bacterium]
MANLYRNIFIILYIFFFIFAVLSIFSYHPNDPSLLKGGSFSFVPKNIFGYVGASFSAVLFQLLGITAYLIIFLLLYYFFLYVKPVIKTTPVSVFLNILGTLFLILSFSTTFSLIKQEIFFKEENILSGGIVGEGLKVLFKRNFNNVGSALIVLLGLIIGFLLFFSHSLLPLKEEYLKFREKVLGIIKKKKEEKIAEKILKEKEGKKEEKKKEVPKVSKVKEEQKKPPENKYFLPDLALLDEPVAPVEENSKTYMTIVKEIEKKFLEFQVKGKVEEFHPGPVVTTYEFVPAGGIKISRILGLQDDLAMALKVEAIRVDRIPGKGSVGIEVPNPHRQKIYLKSLLEDPQFQKMKEPLTLALGKDIYGTPYITSLTQMPHLLVAGTTGSGKSVFLNTLILSLLFKYNWKDLKLILIDLKKVEFSVYENLPHLLVPIISTPKEAMASLLWAVEEMEKRSVFLKEKGMKDLESYNREIERIGSKEFLPYIVIFIDELAELMLSTKKAAEDPIVRLAQMARAVGIHLVLASQRPSVDVITGLIKANFPARISLRVVDKTNSRLILDDNGAEKLLGQGDMLFISPQIIKMKRLHGAYVSPQEVQKVVNYLKSQERPQYAINILNTPVDSKLFPEVEENEEQDPVFRKALEIVLIERNASATYLQRKLSIGFAKAGRFLDIMQRKGIIGPPQGAKPREILIPPEEVSKYLSKFDKK